MAGVLTVRVRAMSKQGQSGGEVWKDRKVVVAVTGGIAAFKACTVVSRLAQAGARVQVLMTEAATKFVGPLTFASLSGRAVITSVWEAQEAHDSEHVHVARWADLVIIAPCTADMLAKLAAGLTDDVVSLTACAKPQKTPLLLAPAMNEQMWVNPITQRNLATVKQVLGYMTVGPEDGWQACRTSGPGRMSEPEAIVAAAEKLIQ